MSLYRRAAKRDQSEAQIVEYLRKAGCSVARVSGKDVPDLIVACHGWTALVEVKTGKAKLKPGQQRFMNEWPGAVFVLRSIADADDMISGAALSIREI